MKVIFLKDHQKIAKKGQLKQVADGLARNFLFPQKIAQPASARAIAELERSQKKANQEEAQLQEKMAELMKKIKGKTFILKRKANKEKIFGSINKADICAELKKSGWEISEEDLLLEQPLKKIGQYEIKVFPKEKNPASFILEIQAE